MSGLRYGIGAAIAVFTMALLWPAPPAAAQTDRSPTRSTPAGPEFAPGEPSSGRLWRDGDPGQRLHLRGRVLSTSGAPITGAEVQTWQADGSGTYRPQYRALLTSTDNGEFRLTTAVPGQYYGEKHIHITISHPDFHPLTTRILFRNDPNLRSGNEDLAIALEEVRSEGKSVMVGSVEFVLEPF